MRRKDREVKDFARVLEIIENCNTIRLAFNDGEYPYIIPLSFGYETEGEQLYFYVHGALKGRKAELMEQVGKCSFEMDRELGLELMPEVRDVTMRYESIIGKADIEIIPPDERRAALDIMMQKNEATRDFVWNYDAAPRTLVARLKVTEWTCKVNPIGGNAD